MLNRISLISNICFEPYWRKSVEQHLGGSYNSINFQFISYESYQDNIGEIASSDIILVCLNFEELYPDILNNFFAGKITYKDIEKDCLRICSELYSDIKKHSKAVVSWFGFEDYCADRLKFGSSPVFQGLVDRINLFLFDLIPKDSFIDLKRMIASIGIRNAYDVKGKYRWNAPYSKVLIEAAVKEIHKQYLVERGITKKCLVLDCEMLG